MHAGNKDNNVVVVAIEKSIWEPMNEGAPGIAQNYRILGRTFRNLVKCGPYCG